MRDVCRDGVAVPSRQRGSSTEIVHFFSICIFFNIFFCTNVSALTTYNRDTLLDINFCLQQRFWDTLLYFTDTEPQQQQQWRRVSREMKKETPGEMEQGSAQTESPGTPSTIFLANVQSLENKLMILG